MFGPQAARVDGGGGGTDLFHRVGVFLADHRLSADPAHYAFAWHVLSDGAGPLAQAVARITDGGVRLNRQDIERLGGQAVAGAPISGAAAVAPASDTPPDAGDDAGLVTRTRRQVEDFATVVRAIEDETRGFGQDLRASAEAMRVGGDALMLDEVARITATMIERVNAAERRLHEATQEADELRAKLAEAHGSARRDPLTGLPNRRALEEAFAARIAAAPAFLAVCDIDRFKQVNDRFGHPVGDRVLSAIAKLLAASCDGQLVARYGGEEFAVLFTGVRAEAAFAMLEGARRNVAARRFRDRDSGVPLGAITFSAGLGAVLAGEALESAFRRADCALYRAKAEGRDRLVVAETPMVGA